MVNERTIRELIKEAIKNAYRILGVDDNASQEEIKKAYRKLAIELHPDRNKAPNATELMAKVNRAWALLGDPDSRRKYDVYGDKTVDGTTPPATQQRPQNPQPPAPKPPTQSQKASSDLFRVRLEKTDKVTNIRNFYEIEVKNSGSHNSGSHYWVDKTYGKVGTTGYRLPRKVFLSRYTSEAYAKTFRDERLKKGFVEVPWTTSSSAGQKQKKEPPKQGPTSTPPPKRQRPQNKDKQDKKITYKIYGKKGSSPVHTRYKGSVYTPGPETKFKVGDTANVGLGSDGRLSVHNPTTGHTQAWEKNESIIRKAIDNLVMEHVVSQIVKCL